MVRPRMLYWILGAFALVGVLALAAYVWSPSVQWRARLVGLKLTGSLPDLGWSDAYRMMRPGDRSLDPLGLFSTGNAYTAIRNPHTSATDISRGAEIFRTSCSTCHADRGEGIGPDLTDGGYEHGSSDWALFQNISRGIPNSGMGPVRLGEVETWQVVAFLQSTIRETASAPSTFTAAIEPPDVTYERLLRADEEARNWLMYAGTFDGTRHSRLSTIDRTNVQRMKLIWAHQISQDETRIQATPLVVDGVMYVSEPPSNVVALDASTGATLWTYRRRLPDSLSLCCGRVNRGLAILGNTLFVGTLDAHLVALDSTSGSVLWTVEVADVSEGYTITGAPLALDDTIVTGVAGGDFGARGFLDAYDPETGNRLWRFHTVPEPGRPGHETWSGQSWRTGGAGTWVTGSFDPEFNLIYWGVGNPAPGFQPALREGDNLYSNSLIALDADTGELQWYFQFTPQDEHDWDANQPPVLLDAMVAGRERKLVVSANKNAFYYVLDRVSGEYLAATPFARQTWADGMDATGRPIVRPDSALTRQGTRVAPGTSGAGSWWAPSYSPRTGLLYVPVLESSGIYFLAEANSPGSFSGDIESASVKAMEPSTGRVRWEFTPPGPPPYAVGGVLATDGDLVFGGIGHRFFALDAPSGEELWSVMLGAPIAAAPITYEVLGRQHVTIAAARTIFTFALDE